MNSNYKILLVEDSDDDVRFFERELKKVPGIHVVARVSSGDDAIAYLAGAERYGDRQTYPWPDIVVLDLRMPNGDGFSVLEWMQGRTPMPQVAIFASSDLALDHERADNLGVTIFQQKTLDREIVHRFLCWLQKLCQVEERRVTELREREEAQSQ